ncbi:MAG: patatin-like phospholipase family protein [Microbacterium sp.]|uniref:patatin-like phospholipase family protein n=1 Tax=Microbacterium sp. TaxID=51671 RepID=UPI001D2C6E10|nr:patatin-like phospholipase family protein [Microbacterium sp.]MBW8761789.1 patatin-like phospholipase family protein [Microbacterium sp.]
MTRTALVLAGGGSTGNAWMIGLTAGLLDGGLVVADADLLIGTSAGATTAAQLASMRPAELFEASLAPVPARVGPVHTQAAADNMARTAAIIAEAADAGDMRRRMGAAAVALDPDGEKSAHWRGIVARRLPDAAWPERRLQIAAVDARSGEPFVFDRDSGVDLADAVAASCSSGFAYAIGDERYIDGGYRRNENADLAAGADRVLVLSPFGGHTRHPLSWGTDLAAQVAELRAAGSRVETVFPGEGTERMLGATAMDLSLRAEAARAGFDHGRELSGQLGGFWR